MTLRVAFSSLVIVNEQTAARAPCWLSNSENPRGKTAVDAGNRRIPSKVVEFQPAVTNLFVSVSLCTVYHAHSIADRSTCNPPPICWRTSNEQVVEQPRDFGDEHRRVQSSAGLSPCRIISTQVAARISISSRVPRHVCLVSLRRLHGGNGNGSLPAVLPPPVNCPVAWWLRCETLFRSGRPLPPLEKLFPVSWNWHTDRGPLWDRGTREGPWHDRRTSKMWVEYLLFFFLLVE